jgi:hypothetical protein
MSHHGHTSLGAFTCQCVPLSDMCCLMKTSNALFYALAIPLLSILGISCELMEKDFSRSEHVCPSLLLTKHIHVQTMDETLVVFQMREL